MQVCICSNQYGERKQLERLFQRSADKLIASGEICYLHTYGSEAALLAEPMNFDLYLLDYQEDPSDTTGRKATELVCDLIRRRNLTNAIFYLAVNKIPTEDVSTRIIYLQKPVCQKVVDEALLSRLTEVKAEQEALIRARLEEQNRPPKNLRERFERWLNS